MLYLLMLSAVLFLFLVGFVFYPRRQGLKLGLRCMS